MNRYLVFGWNDLIVVAGDTEDHLKAIGAGVPYDNVQVIDTETLMIVFHKEKSNER